MFNAEWRWNYTSLILDSLPRNYNSTLLPSNLIHRYPNGVVFRHVVRGADPNPS